MCRQASPSGVGSERNLRRSASGDASRAKRQGEAESLSVKLPDTTDLHKIADILADLNKAFAQVIVEPPVNGELTMTGWEIGTLWLILSLKTIAAVGLAANLVRAALIVRQEKFKGDFIAQEVENYKIKNELTSALKDAVIAQVKALVA